MLPYTSFIYGTSLVILKLGKHFIFLKPESNVINLDVALWLGTVNFRTQKFSFYCIKTVTTRNTVKQGETFETLVNVILSQISQSVKRLDNSSSSLIMCFSLVFIIFKPR